MTFTSTATNSDGVFMCESPSEEQLRPIVQASRGKMRRALRGRNRAGTERMVERGEQRVGQGGRRVDRGR